MDRHGGVTRVQEFVMPSFKFNDKQVEVIPNVSSLQTDLLAQMSSLFNERLNTIIKDKDDVVSSLVEDMERIKIRKNVDSNVEIPPGKPTESAPPSASAAHDNP